jgi:hypothetical protein
MKGCNRLGIQSMSSSWLAGWLVGWLDQTCSITNLGISILSLLKYSSDYIAHISHNSALFGFLFLHGFETFAA